MKRLIIRHAETDANRRTRDNYGPLGASINTAGKESARKLQKRLAGKGVDFSQPVAVSNLIRTRQTAEEAGFSSCITYDQLSEVNTSDIEKTIRLVKQEKLPEEARARAQKLLQNPPKEQIWFSHGLLIAALLDELGFADRDEFIPGMSDYVEVDI